MTANNGFENFLSAETLPAWAERDRDKTKGRTTLRAEPHTEARASSHRWLFSSPETNGICSTGFQTCLRLVTPLLLLFSPFRNGNVYLIDACPTTVTLEADNLFSRFHRSEVYRNFDPGQTISQVSPDLEDEIWEFKLMLEWVKMQGCWDWVNVFCIWVKI